MPTGSCLCGNIRVSYTGDPAFRAMCHCLDCRKLPGGGLVYQIPEANFSVDSGTLKTYTKQSDAGREITTHFCGDCGTAMFRTGGNPRVQGMIGLRAPVLDEGVIGGEGEKPTMEVYVDRRPVWIGKVDGAIQLDSKYQPVDGTSLPSQ